MYGGYLIYKQLKPSTYAYEDVVFLDSRGLHNEKLVYCTRYFIIGFSFIGCGLKLLYHAKQKYIFKEIISDMGIEFCQNIGLGVCASWMVGKLLSLIVPPIDNGAK